MFYVILEVNKPQKSKSHIDARSMDMKSFIISMC
jgi:hypothetical protein